MSATPSRAHGATEPELLTLALAQAAADLARRGWTPATAGNFSVRTGADTFAVSVSGTDKGRLGPADFIPMDLAGRTRDARTPSAEASLHAQLYRLLPETGAILHTHSLTQTIASRHFAAHGSVQLAGYELVKALAGHHTHEQDLLLPVFPNSQDMAEIAQAVQAWIDGGRPLHAYLIAGHGLYAWGRDVAEALRHIEAIDFMIACELELRKLSHEPTAHLR